MQTSLTEGSISKSLIRFALPTLGASVIHMAYSMLDVLFLSWFASPSSLAGAGNAANIVMTSMSLFMGLTSGGMILLGQYFGAKNDKNCSKTTGNVIIIQIGIVIAMTVIVLTVGKTLIGVLNVPTEAGKTGVSAAEEAWTYMRVCVFGFVFQAGYNTISGTLRAIGNSKAPLVFVTISCAVDIVLDYIFIGPFGWGAFGAAFSNVIGQALSFIIAIFYLYRKKLPFAFSIRDVRPDRALMRTIFRLGVPISLQVVLNAISFMVIARIINDMGEAAAAANGVVNQVANLYMIIPYALGSALSVMSAQNLGAGKTDRALGAMKIGVLISIVIAVPTMLFASLKPEALMSIMSPDSDVIAASAAFMIPFSWDFLFVSVVFCMNGLFNGCGITTFVAVHETVAAFLVRIPVSWLLSLIPGATLFHVGIGTPAATLASLIMCLVYYRIKLGRGKIANLQIAGTHGA